MTVLADLVMLMRADIAQYQSDLGKAVDSAKKAGSQIKSALNTALGAIGVGLSVNAFKDFIKGSLDAQDKLNDVSKATQVAATTIGALGFAAEQSGGNLEAVAKGVGKMNLAVANAIGGNKEAIAVFRGLGLSLEDIKNSTPDELFAKLADAFSETEEGAIKAQYAQKIFGKGYQELLPTLDEGGDKLRKNVEYYKQFSGVTEESIKKADEFNDELTKLKLLTGALGNTILEKLIDPMKELVDQFVAFKEESSKSTVYIDAFIEVMKVLAVVAVNTKFTFETIGKEMARFVENARLIAKGDFAGSRALGKTFEEDAKKARADVDALSARILEFNTEAARVKARNKPVDLSEDFEAQVAKPKQKKKRTPIEDSGAKSAAEAAAKARQKIVEDAAKNELDFIKRAGEGQQAILDYQHEQRLISDEEYYRNKVAIAESGTNAEIKVLTDLKAKQEAILSKQPKGTKEYYEAQLDVQQTQAKITAVTQTFGQVAQRAWIDSKKTAEEYRKAIQDIDIQILELTGDTVKASALRVDEQTKNLREQAAIDNRPEDVAKIDRFKELTAANAEFNKVKKDQDAALAQLAISEERIQNSLKVGAISEIDALKKTGDERKKTRDQLEGIVADLERVAAASKNPDLILQAQQARVALEKLATETELLADKFDTIFKDSFSDAFADFISGSKTAKEAFKSFADSVVQQINKIVAQSIATDLANALGLQNNGGQRTTPGGIFASLFGGGGVLTNLLGGGGGLSAIGARVGVGASDFAAQASLLPGLAGSFAAGTDYVPRDGIAHVHAGEAIIPRGGGDGGSTTVNMTVYAQDAASFNSSRGQIARKLSEAADNAKRRGR